MLIADGSRRNDLVESVVRLSYNALLSRQCVSSMRNTRPGLNRWSPTTKGSPGTGKRWSPLVFHNFPFLGKHKRNGRVQSGRRVVTGCSVSLSTCAIEESLTSCCISTRSAKRRPSLLVLCFVFPHGWMAAGGSFLVVAEQLPFVDISHPLCPNHNGLWL